MDGYDEPITLVAAMTIGGSGIHVDYTGTSPASNHGINVVHNYTAAYTSFGLKCIVAKDVPNNAGSLAPLTVSAPEGSILNVQRPWPVAARHVIGHMLPDLVFGCLHQAAPDRVPAEGAASLWIVQLRGGATAVDSEARRNAEREPPEFEIALFNSGGAGARPMRDGLSATAFPSGVRTMPAEATETVAPIVVWRKELARNTGGAGLNRGGLGQVIEIGGAEGAPFSVLAQFERIENPARGRSGGLNGAPGRIALDDGTVLRGKGQQTIPPERRLRLVSARRRRLRRSAPPHAAGGGRRCPRRAGLVRSRAARLRRRGLRKRHARRGGNRGASLAPEVMGDERTRAVPHRTLHRTLITAIR